MRIRIPYGTRYAEVSVPGKRRVCVLAKKKHAAVNARTLLAGSLDRPIGGVSVEGVAAGRKKILVVVPDLTRSAHLKAILPALLKRIRGAGRITVIVATGMHTKHDASQLRTLLGQKIVGEYDVVSHEQKEGRLVRLGRTARGVPIVLNKAVTQHDCIITVGVIEPHLYAGFSGGVKTVAIGLAGRDVIDATHGAGFLDDRSVRIGSIEKNAFQETLREIASAAPIRYSVNIVNDADGRPVKIFAGEPASVFAEGVAYSRTLFEVRAPTQADIVLCGIGYPKDVNLYQASRALNYVANVADPVIRRGGAIIVVAELRDGVGTSSAEKAFYRCLAQMRSPSAFIARVKKEGCAAGEHRAYMVAKVLKDYTVMFVSSRQKVWMRDLPFRMFRTTREAMGYAESIVGNDAKICVIPRALSTIATLG